MPADPTREQAEALLARIVVGLSLSPKRAASAQGQIREALQAARNVALEEAAIAAGQCERADLLPINTVAARIIAAIRALKDAGT